MDLDPDAERPISPSALHATQSARLPGVGDQGWRLVTPTGIYPHHFIGFLALIGAGPDPQQIAQRVRTFDAAELEQMVGEAGMIIGIHCTVTEWDAHPQGQAIANIPVVEIIKIGESDPIPWTPIRRRRSRASASSRTAT